MHVCWLVLVPVLLTSCLGDNTPISPSATVTASDGLSLLLQQAAGVYSQPQLQALENTVLFVVANFGYAEFLENWACWTRRLRGIKFIVYAQDAWLRDLLQKEGMPVYYTPQSGQELAEFANWKEDHFARLVQQKFELVQSVVAHGYDIILSDADVVFLSDPLPHFKYDVDLEFQPALPHSWDESATTTAETVHANTGFLRVRSSPSMLRFLQEAGRERGDDGHFDDQDAIRTVLRRWVKAGSARLVSRTVPSQRGAQEEPSDMLTFRQLDAWRFIEGKALHTTHEREQLLQKLAEEREQVVMVHGNYVKGKQSKKSLLQAEGYWIVLNRTTCPLWPCCDSTHAHGPPPQPRSVAQVKADNAAHVDKVRATLVNHGIGNSLDPGQVLDPEDTAFIDHNAVIPAVGYIWEWRIAVSARGPINCFVFRPSMLTVLPQIARMQTYGRGVAVGAPESVPVLPGDVLGLSYSKNTVSFTEDAMMNVSLISSDRRAHRRYPFQGMWDPGVVFYTEADCPPPKQDVSKGVSALGNGSHSWCGRPPLLSMHVSPGTRVVIFSDCEPPADTPPVFEYHTASDAPLLQCIAIKSGQHIVVDVS